MDPSTQPPQSASAQDALPLLAPSAPANATANPIDFSQTPLAEAYTGFYATIARDTYRIGDRTYLTDSEVSAAVFARLLPFIEDIRDLRPGSKWATIAHRPGRAQGPAWHLAGLKSRLSFLRYTRGQYFQPHCDGLSIVEEDGHSYKSFVTIHLYLSDNASSPVEGGEGNPPLSGGATRFWTPNKKHCLDVEPRVGRVLIFQQRMLVHSGEKVTGGTKYTMRGDLLYEEAHA
ncbi:hypothetical protein K525DRAFT_288420 [Schizophyllum commune Loenen D]|nr:hypothetical protein K525DRAFT_288420 [Schizophyllum commune Loenen D]